MTRAVARAERNKWRHMLGVVKVGASDNDERYRKMWKELSDGEQ